MILPLRKRLALSVIRYLQLMRLVRTVGLRTFMAFKLRCDLHPVYKPSQLWQRLYPSAFLLLPLRSQSIFRCVQALDSS